MAVYQVDIEKSFSPSAGTTVYWTNVYHVDAASVAAAQTQAANIQAAERPIHLTAVNFTKYRVRLATTPGAAGSVTTTALLGTRAGTGTMPLFNVFRVDFSTATGRPSRKYLRGPLLTGDNLSGVLGAAAQTVLGTYAGTIYAIAGICDKQGQAFTGYAGSTQIGMRQLRRGSKRKIAPVI